MESQNSAKATDDKSNSAGEVDRKKNAHEVREAFKVVREISDLLRTGLDPEMLAACMRLIEEGANPEALAKIFVEMSQETEKLDNEEHR